MKERKALVESTGRRSTSRKPDAACVHACYGECACTWDGQCDDTRRAHAYAPVGSTSRLKMFITRHDPTMTALPRTSRSQGQSAWWFHVIGTLMCTRVSRVFTPTHASQKYVTHVGRATAWTGLATVRGEVLMVVTSHASGPDYYTN